jgi:hypothetical protein
MTCFVSAKKKEKHFKNKKKKLLEKLVKRQQAHLGKGNGPLKSSHLKRPTSPYRKSQKGRYSTYKTNCFPLKSSLLY